MRIGRGEVRRRIARPAEGLERRRQVAVIPLDSADLDVRLGVLGIEPDRLEGVPHGRIQIPRIEAHLGALHEGDRGVGARGDHLFPADLVELRRMGSIDQPIVAAEVHADDFREPLAAPKRPPGHEGESIIEGGEPGHLDPVLTCQDGLQVAGGDVAQEVADPPGAGPLPAGAPDHERLVHPVVRHDRKPCEQRIRKRVKVHDVDAGARDVPGDPDHPLDEDGRLHPPRLASRPRRPAGRLLRATRPCSRARSC